MKTIIIDDQQGQARRQPLRQCPGLHYSSGDVGEPCWKSAFDPSKKWRPSDQMAAKPYQIENKWLADISH